ncbi:uncharacterized protein MONBRDRAFT_34237 [Monosiga brevicollis MX1]|uniref:3-dehydrosphinganine reductase n=1 Tax=Monosiga brevicollis TaxID=81824 RepID=A9VAE9_MONBE|nr:uncharacterized protein MONBRDRAFT_34237 [Monosiga brevicollis MX1]EDQ85473.1 predicted protein [Monosiga brevicollis MX1]|eukprot:XP_001749664.1 hypothetical protein [Monosiga brevicollis MX1]
MLCWSFVRVCVSLCLSLCLCLCLSLSLSLSLSSLCLSVPLSESLSLSLCLSLSVSLSLCLSLLVSVCHSLIYFQMAPRKLRDLIQRVRSAKTAAEEREIVQKECADIRTCFRSEEREYSARNVAKLLYIYMLGYPAHFGQVECMKLVSSNRFLDKRIGHLGTMLLLDEEKELHLMVTNSLKQDMNHKVPYVASMALCTLGAIASRDMARDLVGEVEKLIKSSNAYIKKKATLCAVRFMRKDPMLVENFLSSTRTLLSERHHGVLITGITMIEEIAINDPEALGHFRRCRILRLLRILGKGDMEASEAMNDILAEVATNTSSTTNVGNAVLYEAVRCVMEIKAESGLRVLAINNLGRFLLNPDRNIRYVALTTLLRVVQGGEQGAEAVQRHRAVIVDCLREPDVTIRRRALALAFALINSNNVRSVVAELLSFLEVAEKEFRAYMVTELLVASDKFAPTAKWHVDTLLRVLELAGGHLTEEGVAEVVQIIAEKDDLHRYASQRLFVASCKPKPSQPLLQISAWCIGEFGDQLIAGGAIEPEEGAEPIIPSGETLLEHLKGIVQHPSHGLATKEYAMNAIMKLSVRDPNLAGSVRNTLDPFRRAHDEELQQRATEYSAVFSSFDHMRAALLERMPVAESKQHRVITDQEPTPQIAAPAEAAGGGDLLDLLGDSVPASTSAPTGSADNGLLDLLGGGAPASTNTPMSGGDGGLFDLLGGSTGSTPAAPPSSNGGLDDLLGGLLGGSSTPAPAATSAPSSGGLDDLLGGLGGGSASVEPASNGADPFGGMFGAGSQAPAAPVPFEAFHEDGLRLMFAATKQADGQIVVDMVATNSTMNALTNYNLQVAVPRSFTVQLQPASSTTVPAVNSGQVTQKAYVTTSGGAPLKMLLRISYENDGMPIMKQHQVAYLYRKLRAPGFKVEGKHAVITGGSLGLGLEIAKKFAAAGANVTIMARNEAKLKAAVEEISRNKKDLSKICYVPCDVTNVEAVREALTRATSINGAIDYLICSAGMAAPGYFLESKIETHRQQMDVNYFGCVNMVHAALPDMIQAKRKPTIILVSSAVCFGSFVGYSQYSPSKFAVRALADALRNELLRYDIRVMIYFPSSMNTPGFEIEELTKPQETRDIEGQMGLIEADQAAQKLIDGIASGAYSVTTEALGELARMGTCGIQPREMPLLEILVAPIFVVVALGYQVYMDYTARNGAGKSKKE